MQLLAVAALLFAACKSSPPAPPPSTPGSGSAPATGDHAACTADTDCVIVQTTCCDHCNGGSAEAFNTAHADAHRPDPASCAGTVCTKRGCGDLVAKCEAGRCTATQQPIM